MTCPHCGARLVTLSSERPPRLICADCGRVLPVKPGLPPYLWLQVNLRRWLLLGVMLVLPLLTFSFSPWLERRGAGREWPRLGRITTGRVLQNRRPQQSEAVPRRQRP